MDAGKTVKGVGSLSSDECLQLVHRQYKICVTVVKNLHEHLYKFCLGIASPWKMGVELEDCSMKDREEASTALATVDVNVI